VFLDSFMQFFSLNFLKTVKLPDSVGLLSNSEILFVAKPTKCMLQYFLTEVNTLLDVIFYERKQKQL
ncbi:MAG: hypothetical protein K2O32_16365, partial [Acetatifactor sp.]|nr:hypothetical protein [Acetatifactor sp.]